MASMTIAPMKAAKINSPAIVPPVEVCWHVVARTDTDAVETMDESYATTGYRDLPVSAHGSRAQGHLCCESLNP